MQLTPRYLVSDKIYVISNDTGFTVEYRPVYSRNVKLFKGIDNKLQFRLLNADQKPIILTKTPVFVAFDDEQTLVLEKECVIQDDGSTRDTRGMFYVEVTENEMLNIKQQYLSYNIYLDGTVRELTYADRNLGGPGVIYVDGNAFPGPKPSLEVINFHPMNNLWYAGNDSANQIASSPGLNGNDGLHTVAIYTSNYVGNIKIQATLDNQITGQNNWTTVRSIDFDGTETEPRYSNFSGVFNFLRFELDADPTDTVTKILIRN